MSARHLIRGLSVSKRFWELSTLGRLALWIPSYALHTMPTSVNRFKKVGAHSRPLIKERTCDDGLGSERLLKRHAFEV